jgi:hypothetical protein
MHMPFIRAQRLYTFWIHNTQNKGVSNKNNESACHLGKTKTDFHLNQLCSKTTLHFFVTLFEIYTS